MMLVAAIVKPFALDDVRTEPERLEVSGMSPSRPSCGCGWVSGVPRRCDCAG